MNRRQQINNQLSKSKKCGKEEKFADGCRRTTLTRLTINRIGAWDAALPLSMDKGRKSSLAAARWGKGVIWAAATNYLRSKDKEVRAPPASHVFYAAGQGGQKQSRASWTSGAMLHWLKQGEDKRPVLESNNVNSHSFAKLHSGIRLGNHHTHLMVSSKIGWGGLTPSLIICNPIWYWWQNGRYVSRQWSNTRNQNTRISMASAGLCSNWMFVLVCIGLSYFSSPLLLANQQLYTLNEN